MRAALHRRFLAARRQLRDASYVRKWVVLGSLIGVVGGLGAIVFVWALDLATQLFLGVLAGYVPPSPAGEGGAPITDAARPWAIPLVVGLGGLIAGIIVFRFAPEAEGHGTDAAIEAFHHHPRGIRARIPSIKLVASAITIGSGGSGGREGPTAQISAGFGSMLGRVLDLDQHDARLAVAAGMAAGIGAIFRAPLGAAILGAELMYREDFEAEALLPSFIATIVAYTVFGLVNGFDPIFGLQSRYVFNNPPQLIWYALIGIVAGLVGRLYVGGFYGAVDRFKRWSMPPWLKPGIAGVCVGLLALVIPGVLGTGYGWVQASLSRASLLALPLWMVLALPFAKILATSLSIGSGGSGGVFGPGMVIGGLLGASVWRLLEPIAPFVPADPTPFVIVGMMALFGGVAHAPLAVMLMVAEMTGNLGMLAPAMIAVGAATLLIDGLTIYRSQIATRAESPAHRFRFAMPLLASLTARDAARSPRLVLRESMDPAGAATKLSSLGLTGAPVVAQDGKLRGSVMLEDLVGPPEGATLAELAERHLATVVGDDSLDDALGALTDAHVEWAPVVAEGTVVGILSTRDVMSAYRQALAGNVRKVRGITSGGVMLESLVAAGSPLQDRRVADIPWPSGALLVAIERDERLIVPSGGLSIQVGDRISVLADTSAETQVRTLIEGASGESLVPVASPG